MKFVDRKERVPQPVGVEGAEGVRAVGLINKGDGAPTAAMRLFEIQPGGHTPWHAHDWEHVIYGVEGRGALKSENGDAEFGPGDSLLVSPNEQHNFVNTGTTPLKFICVVPLKGDL
jgi:quercetin dioxygenase-like cupin family protein